MSTWLEEYDHLIEHLNFLLMNNPTTEEGTAKHQEHIW